MMHRDFLGILVVGNCWSIIWISLVLGQCVLCLLPFGNTFYANEFHSSLNDYYMSYPILYLLRSNPSRVVLPLLYRWYNLVDTLLLSLYKILWKILAPTYNTQETFWSFPFSPIMSFLTWHCHWVSLEIINTNPYFCHLKRETLYISLTLLFLSNIACLLLIILRISKY